MVVGFGEPVSVSCEAVRPVRILGWESAISSAHTLQDLSVQWKVDSLIDWIEEPICYGVFYTAPRQCEEKLNLVLYSESTRVPTQGVLTNFVNDVTFVCCLWRFSLIQVTEIVVASI